MGRKLVGLYDKRNRWGKIPDSVCRIRFQLERMGRFESNQNHIFMTLVECQIHLERPCPPTSLNKVSSNISTRALQIRLQWLHPRCNAALRPSWKLPRGAKRSTIWYEVPLIDSNLEGTNIVALRQLACSGRCEAMAMNSTAYQ